MSAFWTQRIHENLLQEAGLDLSTCLADPRPAPPQAVSEGCFAAYLDNEVFLSAKKGRCADMMAKAAESLNRAGLPLHEVEGPSLQQVVLGISIDGGGVTSAPTPRGFGG